MVEARVSHCGFVALVGAPNAGKSTLLNCLVGTKVSIVTPKVQTTRSQIRGVAIEGDSQLIFVDTPGIFAPRRRLERAMVDAAWSGAHGADLICVLIDAAKGTRTTGRVIDGLAKGRRQAVLLLNKIDLIKRERLLALSQTLNETGVFTATFMISALTGDGVEALRSHLKEHVPAGPWLYPEDQISDLPGRLLAAEVTREKAFLRLHQELPYALAVATDEWQDFADGSVRIAQTIYVERNTQKAIVLGKGGQSIKQIRELAQKDLETMLERRVHLFIHVKVRENWVNDPDRYREWGLRYDA